MKEKEHVTLECIGERNPNYRPPRMRWRRVEIIAAEGTEFGIVLDVEGDLSLVTRRAGEEWPHGHEPTSGINTIAPGERAYRVSNDERELGRGSLSDVRRHVAERHGQHRENLRLWTQGVLTPTEPDPDERAAVIRELRAAIAELEGLQEIVGVEPPPPVDLDHEYVCDRCDCGFDDREHPPQQVGCVSAAIGRVPVYCPDCARLTEPQPDDVI